MKKIISIISLLALVFLGSCNISDLFGSKELCFHFNEEFKLNQGLFNDVTCIITNNTLVEQFEITYNFANAKSSDAVSLNASIRIYEGEDVICWFSGWPERSDFSLNVDFSNKANVEEDNNYLIKGNTTVYISYADLNEEMKTSLKKCGDYDSSANYNSYFYFGGVSVLE